MVKACELYKAVIKFKQRNEVKKQRYHFHLGDVLKREPLYEPWGSQVAGSSLAGLAAAVPAPAENLATAGAG